MINSSATIRDIIEAAWRPISPFWPLQSIVSVNPLQGLEYLPFDQAIVHAQHLWGRTPLPDTISTANRISIKWCQSLMDLGQARIGIVSKRRTLFDTWKSLAVWDTELTRPCPTLRSWLDKDPVDLIAHHINELGITLDQGAELLTLTLTSLPGWASHVRYLDQWASGHPTDIQTDFLAIRLSIIRAVGQDSEIVRWVTTPPVPNPDFINYQAIRDAESDYIPSLIQRLESAINHPSPSESPDLQMAFCIDVRSEPIRRAIESAGPYQTFGIAGFFNIPIQISDHLSLETHPSCPVIMRPEYRIHDRRPASTWLAHSLKSWHMIQRGIRYLYRTLKYTFSAPFALVEIVGGSLGIAMAIRTLFPAVAHMATPQKIHATPRLPSVLDALTAIPLEDQIRYTEGALRTMGLTDNFAPIILICGHGSSTQNNAFATALDCGACGGQPGDRNARVLAQLLNSPDVRQALHSRDISIPDSTLFMAALHNTTTDHISLFDDSLLPPNGIQQAILERFKSHLPAIQSICAHRRLTQLGHPTDVRLATRLAIKLSVDWAQIRPEWGLSGNASIIVGDRELTRDLDLGGRSFLQSYNWHSDLDGRILVSLLDSAVVVAHWINSQYLFSTINPTAFGSGSKVTHNITGKHSVMQGNASDIMTGLPMQSLYQQPGEPYHAPVRLTIGIMAPIDRVIGSIKQSPTPLQLIINQWAHLVVIDPITRRVSRITHTELLAHCSA